MNKKLIIPYAVLPVVVAIGLLTGSLLARAQSVGAGADNSGVMTTQTQATYPASTVQQQIINIQNQIQALERQFYGSAGLAMDTGTGAFTNPANNSNANAIVYGNPTFTADPEIFSRDLSLGDSGTDVLTLQEFLNSKNFTVSATGYFGSDTKVMLGKWQAATGIYPASGYFGVLTRGQIRALVSM